MALSNFFRRKVTSFAANTRGRYLWVSAAHPEILEESVAPIPKPAPTSTPTFEPRFLRHSSPQPRLLDHSPYLLFPQCRISTLPNGIRVVTQSSPTATATASVGVWIDAGSRFEEPGTNGTAHFLEHMIFKGTGRRTSASLEEEIENMGARLNAYTSREQTTYFADCLSKDVPAAIDVLADILQNSKFPDEAIERERSTILREMEEVQGQMQEVIFDHLHMAAFHGHPLGDTILGPAQNIQRISKVDLNRYIATHYTGPRTVVSAAGDIKHDEVVSIVSQLFTKFPNDPTTVDQLVDTNPAVFTGAQVTVENMELPLVHLAIAFKGAGYSHADSIPLMVIQSMLGSWNGDTAVGKYSGSQLVRRISSGNLADSIMAFNTNYYDTGLFGIYVTAKPECVHGLSWVLMEEFRRLAYEVSEEEVRLAQNQLKSSLLLHIDGSTSVAENNGRQMLTYGRVVPFLEYFARIDAVDAATIKETARNFIIDQDVAVAAVGNLEGLPDQGWFCSQTRDEQRLMV